VREHQFEAKCPGLGAATPRKKGLLRGASRRPRSTRGLPRHLIALLRGGTGSDRSVYVDRSEPSFFREAIAAGNSNHRRPSSWRCDLLSLLLFFLPEIRRRWTRLLRMRRSWCRVPTPLRG